MHFWAGFEKQALQPVSTRRAMDISWAMINRMKRGIKGGKFKGVEKTPAVPGSKRERWRQAMKQVQRNFPR